MTVRIYIDEFADSDGAISGTVVRPTVSASQKRRSRPIISFYLSKLDNCEYFKKKVGTVIMGVNIPALDWIVHESTGLFWAHEWNDQELSIENVSARQRVG